MSFGIFEFFNTFLKPEWGAEMGRSRLVFILHSHIPDSMFQHQVDIRYNQFKNYDQRSTFKSAFWVRLSVRFFVIAKLVQTSQKGRFDNAILANYSFCFFFEDYQISTNVSSVI